MRAKETSEGKKEAKKNVKQRRVDQKPVCVHPIAE